MVVDQDTVWCFVLRQSVMKNGKGLGWRETLRNPLEKDREVTGEETISLLYTG